MCIRHTKTAMEHKWKALLPAACYNQEERGIYKQLGL